MLGSWCYAEKLLTFYMSLHASMSPSYAHTCRTTLVVSFVCVMGVCACMCVWELEDIECGLHLLVHYSLIPRPSQTVFKVCVGGNCTHVQAPVSSGVVSTGFCWELPYSFCCTFCVYFLPVLRLLSKFCVLFLCEFESMIQAGSYFRHLNQLVCYYVCVCTLYLQACVHVCFVLI